MRQPCGCKRMRKRVRNGDPSTRSMAEMINLEREKKAAENESQSEAKDRLSTVS